MHQQMGFGCFADLPPKGEESLDILAGRAELIGLRYDHIMKAQDQSLARCKRGKLRRVRRRRAKDR